MSTFDPEPCKACGVMIERGELRHSVFLEYHFRCAPVLVHADGGDCHGTKLVEIRGGGMMCPKCGISPDMQSTEFWPPGEAK